MEASIIIAGCRSFNNYELLKAKCDEIIKKEIPEGYSIRIISGRARGADMLGERYAQERDYKLSMFPASWDNYGKVAGIIRNRNMGDYAKKADIALLIAFWNFESRGTKDMINYAEKIGITTIIVGI